MSLQNYTEINTFTTTRTKLNKKIGVICYNDNIVICITFNGNAVYVIYNIYYIIFIVCQYLAIFIFCFNRCF